MNSKIILFRTTAETVQVQGSSHGWESLYYNTACSFIKKYTIVAVFYKRFVTLSILEQI